MSQPSLDRIQTWVDTSELSQESGEQIQRWLTEPGYADFVSEIQTLIKKEDLDELEDAFRVRIEFGTGGIRGKMGPGPNRINLRTIGEAAQGLAQYILQTPSAAPKGVVIAHDTRINSERFAKETAAVFAGNGIPARLFDGHRSTPALSFALRETQAVAGVVISASHNPSTDNGFKAYWADGGQVVPPHDKNIIAQVQTVTKIEKSDYDQAVEQGMIQTLGAALDSDYHRQIANLSRSTAREVSIVYTPMHGVGTTSVVPALELLGYQDLHLVEEQTIPDGNFPTVEGGVANPEVPKALSLGIRDAAQQNADLVLASDPDADRLGCALPHREKGWNAPPEELALNGNQIGVILCHYLLKKYQDQGDLPAKGVVCETIVTTDLTGIIARSFGVRVVDNLLVGFKYIGDVIETLPDDQTFLFGTEESHGYLTGSFVRDKDAASAAVLLCECAAEQKVRGKTVRDYLDDIYQEFGYFSEIQESTYREGAQGSQEIARIMEGLRKTPPTQIGGHEIVEVIDRQTGEARNLKTGIARTVEGDKGNVLVFTFTDPGHTRVSARPSGTEPKIKYYVSATSADHSELVLEDLGQTKAGVDRLAREIIDGMLEAADGVLG